MIDRSYLPFQSAREYQDTKMQKWMGFFLSEHASALSDDTNKVAERNANNNHMRIFIIYYSNILSGYSTFTRNRACPGADVPALLGFYDVFKKKSLKDNAVLPVLFLNTFFSSLIFLPFILISVY